MADLGYRDFQSRNSHLDIESRMLLKCRVGLDSFQLAV